MSTTVQSFLTAYLEPSFQESLDRLYNHLGNQTPETWAKNLYQTLCKDPTHPHASLLNRDRKKCLQLEYDLVNAWETALNPDAFEQDIVNVFQVSRLRKILYIGIVMDRAQSLYRMQLPSSTFYGMHWYAKQHVAMLEQDEKDHSIEAASIPSLMDEALENLKMALTTYKGSPTMNRRLYKIIHTKAFGLLQDADIVRWSLPALATFVERPTTTTTTSSTPLLSGTKRRAPAPTLTETAQKNKEFVERLKRAKVGLSDPNLIVQRYVNIYNEPSFQDRLTRLYKDRGSQDPETWAENLYLLFRDDPTNPRALQLNHDRKLCLTLLCELVNEWEEQELSVEFENAIRKIFKPRRIARILGVCLVMDRAQALYKMVQSATTEDGNTITGMHWYSDLHVELETFETPSERDRWATLLSSYPGTGTMNKRLYRLLYSKTLGLQNDQLFARCCKPHVASFVYRPMTSSL